MLERGLNFHTIPPKKILKGGVKMFLFWKHEMELVAVPLARITSVTCIQNQITIAYHTGNFYKEKTDLSESYSDISKAILDYENEETATKKMKDFYWSVSKNTSAFMF